MTKFLRLNIGLSGLLAATGALVCLLTVTAFLGQFWWVFDLTSHFRVQYAAALVLWAAGFGLGRKRRGAIVFSGFAALNLALVLHYCLFGQAVIPQPRTQLRALLANVHAANRRFDLVLQLVRESQPDLIVLEEVNDEWLKNLAALKADYPHTCQQAREDNFGIALFSKIPLTQSEVVFVGDAEVPTVTAEVKISNKVIKILGTHPLPPGNAENTTLRDQQLMALPTLLKGWSGPVILLGDLNTTPWSPTFRAVLRETNLLDSGRGLGLQTTWPANLFPLRIAIDHCLLSRDLGVVARKVGPDIGSDHFPLLIDIAIE